MERDSPRPYRVLMERMAPLLPPDRAGGRRGADASFVHSGARQVRGARTIHTQKEGAPTRSAPGSLSNRLLVTHGARPPGLAIFTLPGVASNPLDHHDRGQSRWCWRD
jgi:hypothetical protein